MLSSTHNVGYFVLGGAAWGFGGEIAIYLFTGVMGRIWGQPTAHLLSCKTTLSFPLCSVIERSEWHRPGLWDCPELYSHIHLYLWPVWYSVTCGTVWPWSFIGLCAWHLILLSSKPTWMTVLRSTFSFFHVHSPRTEFILSLLWTLAGMRATLATDDRIVSANKFQERY